MEEERAKKILLMKISVGIITALVVIFWFLNFQNVWQNNKLRSQSDPNSQQWDELKKEISGSLDGIQKQVNEIEKKNKLSKEADGLLEGVMQETEKLASSTLASSTVVTSSTPGIIASSTASTSPFVDQKNNKIKESACPSYINCMPTVGEARPCQIPAGCEGITQIAY